MTLPRRSSRIALVLVDLGFPLATTSVGFAWTVGKADNGVVRVR